MLDKVLNYFQIGLGIFEQVDAVFNKYFYLCSPFG